MASSLPQYMIFNTTGLIIAVRNVSFPKALKYVFFRVLKPELNWPINIVNKIVMAPRTNNNLLIPQYKLFSH